MWLMATSLGVAGYWTSWQAAARESEEMKAWLGLGPDDRCLGFFVAGMCDNPDAYRGSRKPIQDKVTWKA